MNDTALVIDNGSYSCKGGFSGSESPNCIVPTVVANSLSNDDCLVGTNALSVFSGYRKKYPIEKRLCVDWDSMEKVWSHIFKELNIQSREHPIFLTESPLNPSNCRERMVEIMFEKYNVPSIFIATQAALSLFASGRTNGLVLDSGEDITHVVPIYDGSILYYDIQRLDIGGRDITHYLMKILTENGLPFITTAEKEIAKDIKEKCAYITLDFENERPGPIPSIPEKKYILSDGNEITLKTERFRCTEALFQPHLIGLEATSGIHEIVGNCCNKSTDITIRKELFDNILLAGGNTMFSGFSERLKKELQAIIHPSFNINIIQPPDRQYSAFIGGSIVSSLSSFNDKWTTRQEYNEYGPSIIHRNRF